MLLECQSKFHLEAQLTSDSNSFKNRSTNLNQHNEKYLIDLKLRTRQKKLKRKMILPQLTKKLERTSQGEKKKPPGCRKRKRTN